jgi:release factor glutamine methyltransferase
MTSRRPQETWTVGAVLKWAADDFRARGIESPRLDAELLLAHALDTNRVQLVIDAARALSPDELSRFRELVKRRRAREPVAYLVGRREFYGRSFRVDARVLIPRPDTETLVEVALDRTRALSMSLRGLDLCTGSGCVAITLARERPTIRVHATDLSDDALAVARENALRLGAYNVSFARSDLFESLDLDCSFDLVTANPPYIAHGEVKNLPPDIRNYEPPLALEAGDDGLAVVRRLVARAPRALRPGGVLAIEVGAGQAQAVKGLFDEARFRDILASRDYLRIERVVSGVCSG